MSDQVKVGRIQEINGPIVTVELSGCATASRCASARSVWSARSSRSTGRARWCRPTSRPKATPGEPVRGLGHPLAVELGPGLLARSSTVCSVRSPPSSANRRQHPARAGHPLARATKAWAFSRTLSWRSGATVAGGAILGTVQETARSSTAPGAAAAAGALTELAPAAITRWRIPSAACARRRTHAQALPLPPLAGAHRAALRAPRHAVEPLITASASSTPSSRCSRAARRGAGPVRRGQDRGAATDRAGGRTPTS